MTAWVVIPIRPEGEGKSRLAGALPPIERAALVEDMLRHVVAVASQANGVERTFVAGPMRPWMAGGVEPVSDVGTGLNGALSAAIQQLSEASDAARRVVVVAADLPELAAEDVELLCAVPEGVIGIAPDRHGTGTNAISLPLSAAPDFRFQYGKGSAALHRREAERLGLNVETILSPGLEKDIDEPVDLDDVRGVYTIRQ